MKKTNAFWIVSVGRGFRKGTGTGLMIFLITLSLVAQTPFQRTGQVFQILGNTNALQIFTVSPGFNTINTFDQGGLPPAVLESLGFRRSDNFLYGIGRANNHLYRVGQNAVYQDLGPTGLDNSMEYLAGDITPDGQFLVCIGSDFTGQAVQLAKLDLTAPGFPAQFTPLTGLGLVSDIAIDPSTGIIYGFDQVQLRLFSINPANGTITPFPAAIQGNTMHGLYFDAFGDLYAVGSTLGGIVEGYFLYNKVDGTETRLATGPFTTVSDVASCPYSVEMKCSVDPAIALPCTEITYKYVLANGSGETLNDVEFVHPLPPGFHLASIQQNSFGGLVDTLSVPGSISMSSLTLTPGQRTLLVRVTVGDIPKGDYNSQPQIRNLPPLYGGVSLSDFTKEPGFEDSTKFLVNRFDQDTLNYLWFICHGETITLDASEFGNSVLWNTGAFSHSLQVGQGGLYNFKVATACEEVVVNHDVTSGSCPYTIAIDHLFVPDTTFACGDVVFRYILKNDSGEPRFNISVHDTLPLGFSFVDVVSNPFGGAVKAGSTPEIWRIEGMTLPLGRDTLDVRVHIGDVPPGKYLSRAIIHDLPLVMGPIRLSDDPRTFLFDSSMLVIKGAISDSIFYDTTVCSNSITVLDASSLGSEFLWMDGSTGPTFTVDSTGLYQVRIFDGCEPSDVFWNVTAAPLMEILPIPEYEIHQGQQIQLDPVITNLGDSLHLVWTDPLETSLSCKECPDPYALPLESVIYTLHASNEACRDTLFVQVSVDQSRRIFAPNVFSPNDDGENDYFFLQSPDYAQLRFMGIYDRWGNQLFEARNAFPDDKSARWDGYNRGRLLQPGVYLWFAEIEFIDGKTERFSGDILIVR